MADAATTIPSGATGAMAPSQLSPAMQAYFQANPGIATQNVAAPAMTSTTTPGAPAKTQPVVTAGPAASNYQHQI